LAQDFRRLCSFHLLRRDASGRLPVADDFLRACCLRPKLHPVEASCAGEITLHRACRTCRACRWLRRAATPSGRSAALSMGEDAVARMKPQNLLGNLPLARAS